MPPGGGSLRAHAKVTGCAARPKFSIVEREQGGAVPGAVAALATGEGMHFFSAAGWRCLASGDPVRMDSIIRIASMPKAIASVASLRLVASGHIVLDDEMSRYLPELGERPVLDRFDEGELFAFRSDSRPRP